MLVLRGLFLRLFGLLLAHLLVLDVVLCRLFLRVTGLHRRHLLLMLLLCAHAHAVHFRLVNRARLVGPNLHFGNRQLRFVPHPLDFQLGLLVALSRLRLHLEFLAVHLQQLGLLVQRLRQLLDHLPRLLQLLLQLLRVRPVVVRLQRRRQHLLDALCRFQMAWEVTELQVDVA